MKRMFSSVGGLFVLAAVASPALSNAAAKTPVATHPTPAAAPFLGSWGGPQGNEGFVIPRWVTSTILEVAPNGRFRIIEIANERFAGARRRKTIASGTYRIQGDELITTHTRKNVRLAALSPNRTYTVEVRTYYRKSGSGHFIDSNALSRVRTVLFCVDERDKSTHRLDWKVGTTYRRIQPKSSPFQLL